MGLGCGAYELEGGMGVYLLVDDAAIGGAS
jgi:hypothetical protein